MFVYDYDSIPDINKHTNLKKKKTYKFGEENDQEKRWKWSRNDSMKLICFKLKSKGGITIHLILMDKFNVIEIKTDLKSIHNSAMITISVSQ